MGSCLIQRSPAVLLLCAAAMYGCGVGPRNLPRGDYDHTQSAFEFVQRAAQTTNASQRAAYQEASLHEMRALPEGSGERVALEQYYKSVTQTELADALVMLDDYDGTARSEDAKIAAREHVLELLCRDNAQAWLMRNTPTHPECNAGAFAERPATAQR